MKRLALAILLVAAAGCREPLPVLSTVPAFTLTDQTAKPFGSEDLKGKPWVANFVFTRCPTVCPVFTRQMATVQRDAKAAGIDAHLVSFSVDPGHDTPAVLSAYAERHGADPAMWRFLTGDPDVIKAAVVEGLKVAAEPVTEEDLASVFHGTHFVLVDADLRIRGYYDSSVPSRVEALQRDLARLGR